MSIFSAVAADAHNEELKAKAKYLAEAIIAEDWEKVKQVKDWLLSGPFSE